ncbi:hypothetical protein KJ678_03285 [Patescibacteria group bacterium]|nr:hypothetical protein [Patescibacteria group bacterium]
MYKNPPSKFKTFAKLIDQAILPATILLATKILSLIILNKKFNLDWQISSSGIIYSSKEDFIFANSYSSLFMFISITIGLILLTVKATQWHSTHIRPSLAARFYEKKLDFLVTDSRDIYPKSVIWLSYAWLATILMLIQNYYGLLISWISYVALFITIIPTVFIVLDLEKELSKQSNKNILKKGSVSFLDLSQVLKS